MSRTQRGQSSLGASQRAAVVVLAAGAVVALAAAFGGAWWIRVGVVVAIVAGVVAVVLVSREITRTRRRHGRQLVELSRRQTEALSRDRAQRRAVLETLDAAYAAARTEIGELTRTIGDLRGQIATLRGDHAALQQRLGERDARIAGLERDLATREAELRAWSASDDAEILALPRHVRTDAAEEALPTAADLWGDGEHPTVVDLGAIVLGEIEPEQRRHA